MGKPGFQWQLRGTYVSEWPLSPRIKYYALPQSIIANLVLVFGAMFLISPLIRQLREAWSVEVSY
jgi:hypothetical protein